MTPLSLRARFACALFAAGAAWLPSVNAAAQDCSADADCGAGYRCQTDSYESCSGEIMCTPDGECTETEAECETVSYSWCTNATCESDSDCPSTMACQEQTTWQCSGGRAGSGAGGDGSDDEMPSVDAGAPTCVEVPADSLCMLRYQLPCTVASDCGGGFDCVQSVGWECSGGGGDADGGTTYPAGSGGSVSTGGTGGMTAPGSEEDAGVSDPGGDYECHEVPGTDYYCRLQDLPCTADSECPDGLLCLDQFVWTCDGGGSAGAAAAGSGASTGGTGGGVPPAPDVTMDADGGTTPDECTVQAQQRCMPPEYEGGGFPGSGGMGGSSDGGVSDPDTGGGSAGSGGSASPPTGGGGGSSGGDDESEDGPGNGHDHGNGSDRGNHFGWLKLGCSAGGPIGGDPIGWLALGMAALVLRRRARRLS